MPIPEEYLSGRIVIYSFKLYSDFLRDMRGKYDMVLTSDIRDVIFQRDFFSLCDASKPFLGLALEDAVISGDPQWNAQWIIDDYGNDIYQEVKDDRIKCMGTVWGTYDEFTSFIEELTHELETRASYGRTINDQGSANVILHYNKKFHDILKASDNADGYVMTIGLTNPQNIHTDSSGNILNGKGEIAAVVHQYDRKPELVKLVHKKYGQGMTIFGKMRQTSTNSTVRRIANFIVNIRNNGFIPVVSHAIKRRIHR